MKSTLAIVLFGALLFVGSAFATPEPCTEGESESADRKGMCCGGVPYTCRIC